MYNIEIIAGCTVYTYEIKNDDIYGSNINEEILRRRHNSRMLERRCERVSPSYRRKDNSVRI